MLVSLFINLSIIFFPILMYIPDLFKTKSSVPLSVSVFISLACLLEIFYSILNFLNKTKTFFNFTIFFKSLLLFFLHIFLLSKNPFISSLEEKIYYSNKKYFTFFKISLKRQITAFYTSLISFCLVLCFFRNQITAILSELIGYSSIFFNVLSLLTLIAIKKTEKKEVLFINKRTNQNKFQNYSYKLMGMGHFFKFYWFLRSSVPYLLVLVEIVLGSMCLYIGFS